MRCEAVSKLPALLVSKAIWFVDPAELKEKQHDFGSALSEVRQRNLMQVALAERLQAKHAAELPDLREKAHDAEQVAAERLAMLEEAASELEAITSERDEALAAKASAVRRLEEAGQAASAREAALRAELAQARRAVDQQRKDQCARRARWQAQLDALAEELSEGESHL